MNQKIIVKENSPVVLAAGRQNLIVESADIVIPQIGQRRVLILPTGAQGLEGPPGLDGPQGPQGPEGPQPPLSVNEPKPLGVADSGVSVVAARDDHVHAIPNASQIGAALSTHSHSQSDVVNLESSLAQKVSETRVISSGAGLVGGGDLSENRTLSVIYGQTSGTAAQGDDSRFFAPNSGCPYKSGFYYSTAPVYPEAYSFETTSVYLYPWAIGRADVILDRMCVDVRTLASGGKVYLGVYDTVDGVPKNLIGTAGYVTSDSTGFKEAVCSISLPLGLVWLGLKTTGANVSMSGFANNRGSFFCGTNVSSPYHIYSMSVYRHGLLATDVLPSTVSITSSSQTWNVAPTIFTRSV